MSGLRTRLVGALQTRAALWRQAMTLGVRGLVRDGQGRVLLVRHTYVPGWYMPGGGVERGETAMDALVRELREEAGVVPAERPVLFGLYRNPAGAGRDHVALYVVGAFTTMEPSQQGEIAERGWFHASSPPNGATPATVARLAEVLDGAPVRDVW